MPNKIPTKIRPKSPNVAHPSLLLLYRVLTAISSSTAPPSKTMIANAYARKASASTVEKESTQPPNAPRRNLDPESTPLRKIPPSREKRKLRRPQGTYGGCTTKTFSSPPGSLCRNPGCSREHRPASGTTRPRAQQQASHVQGRNQWPPHTHLSRRRVNG